MAILTLEDFAASEHKKLMAERQSVIRETRNTEYKSANGFGQLEARIPMREFLKAQIVYGKNCWQDKDFMKAYLRDNPELRVKTTRTTRGAELPKGTLFVPPKYANG